MCHITISDWQLQTHTFKCRHRHQSVVCTGCLITRLAIRLLIVLTDQAGRLVNRWECGGTHSYPAPPTPATYTHMCMLTHMHANTHSIYCFFFFTLGRMTCPHKWVNKRTGHHLVDPGANGAAQLRFDFQWTDRDSALMLVCAVYV